MQARKPKENSVESYLVARVKAAGGKIAKFTSPGENGHPDRVVCLPGRPAFLVETKRGARPLEPLQAFQAREWEMAGMRCYRAGTKEDVDAILAQA